MAVCCCKRAVELYGSGEVLWWVP